MRQAQDLKVAAPLTDDCQVSGTEVDTILGSKTIEVPTASKDSTLKEERLDDDGRVNAQTAKAEVSETGPIAKEAGHWSAEQGLFTELPAIAPLEETPTEFKPEDSPQSAALLLADED